jgi:hypothetical protein
MITKTKQNEYEKKMNTKMKNKKKTNMKTKKMNTKKINNDSMNPEIDMDSTNNPKSPIVIAN